MSIFTCWRVLPAALFVLSYLLFPQASFAAEKALNILYTGAMRGELEPCGCSPETQSGGLARLSGFISDQKAALGPYILVDSGNTFAPDTAQGRLKAEAQLRSLGMMGYDAVAVHISKAPFDSGFTARLVKEHRVATLPKRGAIKALKGGLKVNISSDARLLKKGMINVLISGKPVGELKAVKGWDVVITSSGEVLEEPVRSGRTTIVSGYPKGEKLGILTLKLDRRGKVAGSAHRWVVLKKDAPEDPAVRAVLKEYDQKVAALLKEEELKPVSGGLYLGARELCRVPRASCRELEGDEARSCLRDS